MLEIQFTSDMVVKPIQSMGSDQAIAAAAKASIDGIDSILRLLEAGDEVGGLIRYCMKHRHGSPFEHSAMTVVVRVPIFVLRQWHRHRIGFSYNEESGRYKQLEPLFWIPRRERLMIPAPGYKPARPKFVLANDHQYEVVKTSIEASSRQAWASYREALNAGIASEVARSVLPVNLYSTCWVTCNPRSVMSFLSLRTHEPTATFPSYPQAEIEEAARAAEDVLRQGWPLTHAAFVSHGRVAP